ncbi:helix-turn-helix domain-containing protein [Microbacterium sp. NPDC096154]|uniref:helix-turn-helix domain-containing protein n=1 Tax=Microbacterium sp. NPDC096154 TaxID=3155549 RepID=UPI00332CCA0F
MTASRPAPRIVSNAEQIKALTHPLRVRLIDLFRGETQLTATQCAEATGESVASCSFHLRQLEKYGFLERGEPRGRERPWRAPRGQEMTLLPEPGDREAMRATQAAGQVYLDVSLERLRAWMARSIDDDPSWTFATAQQHSSFWATREELSALADRIAELTAPFTGRAGDPSLRPPDARLARLLAVTWTEIPAPGPVDGDEEH